MSVPRVLALVALVIAALTGLTAAEQIGPSFDCAAARQALARILCADADLSQTDLRFAQAYFALLPQLDDSGRRELKQEDLRFLEAVQQHCGIPLTEPIPALSDATRKCLKDAYESQRSVWLLRLRPPFSEEARRPIEQHIKLQRSLQQLGFLSAAAKIDGVYGPGTREAISRWQNAQSRTVTGTLGDSDGQALEKQASQQGVTVGAAANPEATSGNLSPKPAAAAPDPSASTPGALDTGTGAGSHPSAREYPLGSLTLSKPLSIELKQNYSCVPRIEFFNTLQCSLKNSAPARAANISDILVDNSNGNILFASTKSYRPGGLAGVERSVFSEISDTLGLAPKRFSVDNAVVAVWGGVKLEAISPSTDEYRDVKGIIEQRYGLLVDMLGDFKAAKDAGRPVYRVIGGDGLVVILSQNGPTKVVVQRFIVMAGILSENNFKSQAHQFFITEQHAVADDYSRWPEIAFMIRRLALNTITESANRVVDEVFGSTPSKKYYSHIWAFLPMSVRRHLRDGTYMSDDIFGEKTDFPDIRGQIIAQLNASPGEPFSEFLLYTLGRFGEAVQFNQRSAIHTVLAYAFAHSNFKQVMSHLFPQVSKPNDREMLLDEISPGSYLEDIDPEDIQFQSAEAISRYKEAMKKKQARDRKQLQDENKRQTEKQISAQLVSKDFFNGHAYEYIPNSHDPYKDNQPSLTQYINYFNKFPERYESRPMVKKLPDFTSLTEPLLSQFGEVLKDRESPHFDDAAYFLGWLEYHRGNVSEALDKFEIAIAPVPKGGSRSDDNSQTDDYAYNALRQAGRILRTLSPEDAIGRVQGSKILSSQPQLWYTVLESFYHLHKHQLVMEGARRALREFGVTIEELPVTTDPDRITAALTKLKLVGDPGLGGIVYLYNSSREAERWETRLLNIDKEAPSSIEAAIKAVVIKYSLTKDSDLENNSLRGGPRPQHKDLRQSIYLAQRSLDLLPKNAAFSKLRAWLHYKRITLLAQFDPLRVAAANGVFQEEFPSNSTLLNDGMAEQIFAEAVVIGDMARATATFNALLQKFPTGNAVDNAYSWMAIGWTCAGQPVKALEVNQKIIRLFPLTRHARYARERLREPLACSDLQGLYNWDYNAMRWRERNRIDLIQHALEVHQL